MKLRKKLMVWGAFLVMGLLFIGCTEESYFDSVVSVEETSGENGSSVGNARFVKDNIGDALMGLFDEEGEEAGSSEGPIYETQPYVDEYSGDGETSETVVVDNGGNLDNNDTISPEKGSLDMDSKIEGDQLQTQETETEEITVGAREREQTNEEPAEEKQAEEEQAEEEQKVEEQPEEAVEQETEEVPEAQAPDAVEAVESKDLEITVIIMNEAGVNFGLISVIDPYTKEQQRLGALGKEEMFVLKMSWPSKEKHFRMGIYDTAGNLQKEETVNFHGISSGGVITLTGDGSLNEIVSEIE